MWMLPGIINAAPDDLAQRLLVPISVVLTANFQAVLVKLGG